MAGVNHTRPHCVNQMGKTYSKHLVAWHGRGTAWARHAMCESALRDDLDQLGREVASLGKHQPTFRRNMSLSSSRVQSNSSWN